MLRKVNEVRSEEISEEDYSKVIQICQKLDNENTYLKSILSQIKNLKPSNSIHQHLQSILSQKDVFETQETQLLKRLSEAEEQVESLMQIVRSLEESIVKLKDEKAQEASMEFSFSDTK